MALDLLPTMRKLNSPFGKAVKAVMEEHGLSLRGQRVRTGLSHVTVQQMMEGVVPQMESVVAFAKGFSLDVNEWLELAGYDPIETGADVLLDGWEALCEKYPETEIPLPRLNRGTRTLTAEEARSILAMMEDQVRRGVYKARPS